PSTTTDNASAGWENTAEAEPHDHIRPRHKHRSANACSTTCLHILRCCWILNPASHRAFRRQRLRHRRPCRSQRAGYWVVRAALDCATCLPGSWDAPLLIVHPLQRIDRPEGVLQSLRWTLLDRQRRYPVNLCQARSWQSQRNALRAYLRHIRVGRIAPRRRRHPASHAIKVAGLDDLLTAQLRSSLEEILHRIGLRWPHASGNLLGLLCVHHPAVG